MFAGKFYESIDCEQIYFYEDDSGDDASVEPGW